MHTIVVRVSKGKTEEATNPEKVLVVRYRGGRTQDRKRRMEAI